MLRTVSIRAVSASLLVEWTVYFYLTDLGNSGECHTLRVGVPRRMSHCAFGEAAAPGAVSSFPAFHTATLLKDRVVRSHF